MDDQMNMMQMTHMTDMMRTLKLFGWVVVIALVTQIALLVAIFREMRRKKQGRKK